MKLNLKRPTLNLKRPTLDLKRKTIEIPPGIGNPIGKALAAKIRGKTTI